MATLQQFNRNMRRRAEKLTRNVDVAIKQVAKSVTAEVIDGTPVDTGRARSNWQASIDARNEIVIQPYAPGRRLGRGEGANKGAAIATANAVIDRRKTEEKLFIQNNVPYIRLLNAGSSQQAPDMFVQMAVLRGIRLLNGRAFLK